MLHNTFLFVTVFIFLLTSETTFAGISCGQGLDAVWRVGNLIPSIFNGDGVGPCRVRHIRHCVGAIPVILDGCILWFALRVLSVSKTSSYFRTVVYE